MHTAVYRVAIGAADDAVEHEIRAAVLVGRAHHFDEDALLHEERTVRHLRPLVDDRLQGDVLDEAVLRRLDDDALIRLFLLRDVVDHRDVCVRILMKTQHGREVHVVDVARVCEKHILLCAVLDEIDILVKGLEVAGARVLVALCGRQIEHALVTPRKIPVLARAQVIHDGTRLLGQHDADMADPGVDHARKHEINDAVTSHKRHGADGPALGQLLDAPAVFLQVDESHDRVHNVSLRSLDSLDAKEVQPAC